MIIRVKNHHMPPMIRVDRALGISSEPGVGEGKQGRANRGEEPILYIQIYFLYPHIDI